MTSCPFPKGLFCANPNMESNWCKSAVHTPLRFLCVSACPRLWPLRYLTPFFLALRDLTRFDRSNLLPTRPVLCRVQHLICLEQLLHPPLRLAFGMALPKFRGLEASETPLILLCNGRGRWRLPGIKGNWADEAQAWGVMRCSARDVLCQTLGG